MSRNTRILIADDHRLIREGLRVLIDAAPGHEVVGEAENGRAAVNMATELKPDAVVMDINMPDLDGITATQQLRAAGCESKVVALSAHSDTRFVLEMLKAGATGFVVKESAFEELASAINAAMAGKVFLSPSVAGRVVQDAINHGAPGTTAAVAALSPREREVLQLMAEGQSTKQIAYSLDLSIKTVETHRRNIMGKLDMDSVAQLTKYAIREGLTSL